MPTNSASSCGSPSSRRRAITSFRLRLSSSSVSPWLWAPGKPGTYPTYTPVSGSRSTTSTTLFTPVRLRVCRVCASSLSSQPAANPLEQHAQADRLDEVIEGAGLEGPHLVRLARAHGGEDDPVDPGSLPPQRFEDRVPVEFRKVDVEQQEGAGAADVQRQQLTERFPAVAIRQEPIAPR